MKKLILLFSLVIICSLNNKVTSQTVKNEEIKKFLDTLSDKTFSGTILVAKNDTIIEKRAYGLSSKEFNVKNKIDTKFNIASITKSFTAAAILKLYDEGKIELDEPIKPYLKEYPNETVLDSVTIHHLLTHTAGTKAIYGENYKITNKDRYKRIKDYLPLFATDSLAFSPGSKYEYNGGGYVILALIIENISGQSYYNYLQENIFNPLGMNHTQPLEIDGIHYNTANGYSLYINENKSLTRNDYQLSKASGASGYYSTIEDLFKFSKALRNNKLLSKKTTELMLTPKVKGYNTYLGYGIDIDQRSEEEIIGHNGGWYGIKVEWMDFINSNYTVIILSNFDNNGKDLVSNFFKKI